MKQLRILAICIACILAASCATMKKDNRDQLSKIKSVAVVLFTVPEKIVYRPDPRETMKKNMLTQAIKMLSTGDGTKAATLAHNSFIEELNSNKLSFSVLQPRTMLDNEQFVRLATPPEKFQVAGVDVDMVAGAISMFSKGKYGKKREPTGAAPESMRAYGIAEPSQAWSNTDGEVQFVRDAIASLDVDAAIIVSDPGMSFYCHACVLVASAGASGISSTGSNYTVAIVDKRGKILYQYHHWFTGTDATAKMIASAVNPEEHGTLFTAHGKTIGKAFSEDFARLMAGAKP
ncbi:MAG: hypothetical protein OEZ58_01435 [Gammaproteobacteria bacterium]|nr:hypothetical protein [Gammaproteobacteria bacterium]MDH5727639.1 hypothetical protein [Gammaproteobacteria bacterium]